MVVNCERRCFFSEGGNDDGSDGGCYSVFNLDVQHRPLITAASARTVAFTKQQIEEYINFLSEYSVYI